MKEILILLVLLIAKAFSLPYQADSGGNCRDTSREYKQEGSNLCCKKCPPGSRVKEECTQFSETVCDPCGPGQYMEGWNYYRNCFSCTKCKAKKGLQYVQNCTATTRSRCMCQPGMYCIVGFHNPYCDDCKMYRLCKTGYGVSVPGTANSDVRCEACHSGTFSDSISYTDTCRPHTNCNGMAVLREGDATSDNVCDSQSTTKQYQAVFTTASTTTTTVATTSDSTTSPGQESIRPMNLSVTSQATQSATTGSDSGLAVIIAVSIVAGVFVFSVISMLCICKRSWKRDCSHLPPKVDANGNCESADKVAQRYFEESQMTCITAPCPEQQHLLEKGEAGGDHSQCSSSTETRTEVYSSHDSISPSQSTFTLNYPPSALSEPMPLISNIEPISPQPSNLTRSSSQPSSAHVISPVTTSPHVNVNITLHIGNGSCGTPSFMPADLMQEDCKLPFGAEEESFSIPQQEAGKPSLMSVQESGSYST